METTMIIRGLTQQKPELRSVFFSHGGARYFGGGGSSSPERIPTLEPEQLELLRNLIGQINPGQSITPFGGERVAGLTPPQTSAFDLAGGFAPGVEAGLQGFGQFDPAMGGQFMGMGTEALKGALEPFDPTSTQEAWQANMRPAFNMWRDEVVPAIQEKGVRMTGTGDAGGIGREISRSGRDLATNQSAILSNALLSGEQFHKGRQSTGINQAMGMARLPGDLASRNLGLASLGLGQMAGVGGEERGINQQFLGAERDVFNEAQAFNNPWLQFLPQALGTSAFDTVVGQEGPSMASELAPYVLAAAAAFSDIRVKENIVPIDKALEKIDELTGSMFDYKGLKGARTGGVMAQDIEKVLPDAVTEVKGVKCVNMNAVIALLVNAVKELKAEVRGK